MSAFSKDIFNTIVEERKRFISLLVISILGVLITTGLRAACEDTKESAVRFYESQKLRDFYIQSTLGLTEDDIEALLALEGVSVAEGFYEEEVYFSKDNIRYSVLATTWGKEVDKPYIVEGSLPEKENEIAITKAYADAFDLKPGDKITLKPNEDTSITCSEYVITAIVLNATDVNNTEGSCAFRSTATTDYVAFISKEAIDTNIYTGIAVSLKESENNKAYSDSYKNLIDNKAAALYDLKLKCEDSRTQSIIDEALKEIQEKEDEMLAEFEKAEKELADAHASLDAAKTELDSNQALVDAGYVTDPVILAQIEAGWKAYEEGLDELNENEKKYLQEKQEAEDKIKDAREEAMGLDKAQWYIFTRENLSGYVNISTDMEAIESLTILFALIFLFVAVMVSSITVNRLIEEHRGIIGTYQALGFTDFEVMLKYLTYALSAGLLGGIIGDVFGYVIIPKILFMVFEALYVLPGFYLQLDIARAILIPLIFILSILITIVFTCTKAFNIMPAELMRPKAPKPGMKVMLERIPFIWKNLSFLNKVTARNIFRYKRRLLMTLVGIVGCTALLVCGFGVKNSVDHLLVHQYEEIVHYDLLSVCLESDVEAYEEVLKDKEANYIRLHIESVSLKNEAGKTMQMQMYVFENTSAYTDYMSIKDRNTNADISFKNGEIYITQNAGVILDFTEGAGVSIQDSGFTEAAFTVANLVDNYLGNMVYMNRETYESAFGEYRTNAVMVLSDRAEELADDENVRTGVTTERLKSEFTTSFWLINMVVYILIGLSAALAFVVLFTLSSTNVSERERELATIKVLGFFDREVHLYINKEVTILTLLATLIGLPVGAYICGLLTEAIRMPSLYFQIYIKPVSFVYAFVITVAFSLIVNFIMHRSLDEIDPAVALKSIE